MSATTSILLLGVALAWIAAGGVLTRRRHRLPGALAITTGAAVALGGTVSGAAEGQASQSALTAAGLLFGPLTLATYPGRGPLASGHRTVVALIGACGAVGIAATWWGSDGWLTAAVLCAVLILGGHIWWRIERSDGEERHALAWACVGVAAAGVVLFLVGFVVPGAGRAGEALGLIAVCLIPSSLVVGTRPRRVLDPRLVTVAGAVLIGAVMATMSVFVLLSALLEILAGPASDGALAVIAVIAATTFHPTRVRLRGVVDALLFGSRPDPLEAATEVATGVGHDPQAVLETIRAAMVLPYATLEVDGSVVAVSGQVGATSTHRLPLPAGGELLVGLRPGDLGLPEDDERVLRLVAPLLSLTLQAHQLNDSLRESRTQTRAAIEEERRRLRRDLHDGLGPQLSGIAFTADAVANLLTTDPDAARELIRGLRADAGDAIADVRRLVYGMRPPALDELGLVGALEQRSRGLATTSGTPLAVRVSADPLPTLPASVEVAAYRIATEAIANASRHSTGTSAHVRLEVIDKALHVIVQDSGNAADSSRAWVAGVGVQSMRERAAETGGTLTCGPTAHGGHVEAVLPIAQ